MRMGQGASFGSPGKQEMQTMIDRFQGGAQELARGVVICLLAWSAVGTAWSAGPAPAAMLEQARSLLQSGAADQAHRLLAAQEQAHAGDPRFDYLLGVAALEAGNSGEALFALRRVVVQRPQDLGARVDLARAYFGYGDMASAKDEFDALLVLQPPPETRLVIARYLRAIDRRSARSRPRWAGWAALELGADTNANSATDLSSFQDFELAEESRGTPSPYAHLLGAGSYSRPLTARLRLLLDAQLEIRQYSQAQFVNRLQYAGAASVDYDSDRRAWWLRLGGISGRLDGRHNDSALNLDLGWEHRFNPTWSARLDVRQSRLRFTEAVAIRDVDETLLALGVRRPVGWWRGGVAGASVLLGKDTAARSESPYSRDIYGFSANTALVGMRRTQWLLSSSLIVSDYAGSFVGSGRQDKQFSIALTVNLNDPRYPIWVLRPQLGWSLNRSSIELYDYDRVFGGIQLRRVFE